MEIAPAETEAAPLADPRLTIQAGALEYAARLEAVPDVRRYRVWW
jgi:hypothetical protein